MSLYRSFVVVNPQSANGSTRKLWPKIEAAFNENLGEFDHAFTHGPGEASLLTKQALEKGYEMVVSVGGDGTHNEVINGFFMEDEPVRPGAVLGLISRGTGSDLIKTVGIPKDFTKAAEALRGKATRTCDVGKMTFTNHEGRREVRYFMNIGDLGFGGEVVMRVNSTSKALGGFLSFYLGALRTTFRYRNKPCRFVIDDNAPEDIDCFMIVAANGRYFGGGMLIAPEAEIDDGLLEFVIMEDFNFWNILFMNRRIYKGKLSELKKVRYAKGKKISVNSDEEVYIDLDGEQPGKLPCSFELLPGAVNIKVPPTPEEEGEPTR